MARPERRKLKRGLALAIIGGCLCGKSLAQVTEPLTVRAVAGEARIATLHDRTIIAITSTNVTPSLDYPLHVVLLPGGAGLKIVSPPATPPGDYTLDVIGRNSSGREVAMTIHVTIDAVTVGRAASAGRPPVILLNGFQLLCTDDASTLAASMDTFDLLYTLLQDDGAPVLYFNNCAYGDRDLSIEQLGAQLGAYIAGLTYT